MTKGKDSFKNIKLGKNVHRQIKRKGPPQPVPQKFRDKRPFEHKEKT
jgi:hypothetical protein